MKSFRSIYFSVAIALVLPKIGQGGIYRRYSRGELVINTSVGSQSTIACPQSCLYQDVELVHPSDVGNSDIFAESGRQYVRIWCMPGCARNQNLSYKIRRYKVKVDFSEIKQIYPYDTSSELYRTYTRQPLPDEQGFLTVDTDNAWIIENATALLSTNPNALEYARAAYELVIREFTYGGGWPHTVSEVIRMRSGVCFWLSAVYVSLLRKAGIPARCISGETDPRIGGIGHAWAEFYLEGYGWIPADITQDVCRKTKLTHFGVYDNCFIATAMDTHVYLRLPSGDTRYCGVPTAIFPNDRSHELSTIAYIEHMAMMPDTEELWDDNFRRPWQICKDAIQNHPTVVVILVILIIFYKMSRPSVYD